MDLLRRILHGGEAPFTPIPGSFPEPQQQQEHTVEETNSTSQNVHPTEQPRNLPQRTIAIVVLQFPLVVLYYVVSIIITMISLLKPLSAIQGLYKNNKNRPDPRTRLNTLLEQLSNESERNHDMNEEDEGLTTYSFGCLYNLENGSLSQDIVQGSYTDLLSSCSGQCKFAIIYLHDPLLDNTSEYVKGILCTDKFTTLVKKYQLLLWYSDITTSEGLQVANALKVRQFPFLGVLCLKAENKIELFGRMEGDLRRYQSNYLENILAKGYSRLLQIRQQRQNVALQQLIREQQDNRYNESLRADQQREAERSAQISNLAREQEQGRLQTQWLLWRKSQLKPEPSNDSNTPACKIAIKIDSDHRIIRKFDASLPIEEIYAFVELHKTNTLNSTEIYNSPDPPAGYHHEYNFRLVSPAPRNELDTSKIIRDEAAIFPSGTIIIEEMD